MIDLVDFQKKKRRPILNYFESPLKGGDAIRSIKLLAEGKEIAFGTEGGRVNISGLAKKMDSEEVKPCTVMQFKAHKIEKMMYPVNSILVNSRRPQGFIGTCGGEGKIVYWDYAGKNKICEFQMKNPVTCAKMSWDGKLLACATGNDWTRGVSEHMMRRSEVSVRLVDPEQLYGKV